MIQWKEDDPYYEGTTTSEWVGLFALLAILAALFLAAFIGLGKEAESQHAAPDSATACESWREMYEKERRHRRTLQEYLKAWTDSVHSSRR